MANGIEILVRAVIEDAGRFLLARSRGAWNTFLPGGHPEPGESLVDALKRELDEELCVTCSVERYLGAVEHTWDDDQGRHFELNHCFAVSAPDLPRERPPTSMERGLEFLWAPSEGLAEARLEPAPLVDILPRWREGSGSPWWASTLGGGRLGDDGPAERSGGRGLGPAAARAARMGKDERKARKKEAKAAVKRAKMEASAGLAAAEAIARATAARLPGGVDISLRRSGTGSELILAGLTERELSRLIPELAREIAIAAAQERNPFRAGVMRFVREGIFQTVVKVLAGLVVALLLVRFGPK